MGEKLTAGLVTAAVIAPLCAVCILGPAFLTSIVAWVGGWIGGIGSMAATGLAIAAGLAVYGLIRWKKARAASDNRMTAHSPRHMDKPAQ